ncbi:MAG: antibiotic biosynthesis monooxygenase family protein, partial [Bacteroidota bacterium]
MILRIVKMTFQSDKLAAFHALFDQHKNKIRHSPGCHRLELHADAKADNVRYTYSYWEDEASLRPNFSKQLTVSIRVQTCFVL